MPSLVITFVHLFHRLRQCIVKLADMHKTTPANLVCGPQESRIIDVSSLGSTHKWWILTLPFVERPRVVSERVVCLPNYCVASLAHFIRISRLVVCAFTQPYHSPVCVLSSVFFFLSAAPLHSSSPCVTHEERQTTFSFLRPLCADRNGGYWHS